MEFNITTARGTGAFVLHTAGQETTLHSPSISTEAEAPQAAMGRAWSTKDGAGLMNTSTLCVPTSALNTAHGPEHRAWPYSCKQGREGS